MASSLDFFSQMSCLDPGHVCFGRAHVLNGFCSGERGTSSWPKYTPSNSEQPCAMVETGSRQSYTVIPLNSKKNCIPCLPCSRCIPVAFYNVSIGHFRACSSLQVPSACQVHVGQCYSCPKGTHPVNLCSCSPAVASALAIFFRPPL